MKGRKRHRACDTPGNTLVDVITPASVQDRDGARELLRKVKQLYPWVTHVWADGEYTGELVKWAKKTLNITLEIVKKLPDQQGFQVLKRRWVIERSFAWTDKFRRLSKDYELYISSSHAFNTIASISLLLNKKVLG